MGIVAGNMTRARAGGMGIEIDMTPTPIVLVASFNKLGADIKSFKEPLRRSVQQVIAPSIRRNFDQLGRPEKWEHLAEATIERKSRLGYQAVSSRPLHRGGSLRQKAGQLNQWDIDGVEGVAKMSVSEDIWYGRIHQEGAGDASGGGFTKPTTFLGQGRSIGSKGYVPQREWALIQDEDVDEIEKVFDKWLEERVEGSLWPV